MPTSRRVRAVARRWHNAGPRSVGLGGRRWSTEFGDKAWDELNLIRPGRNYAWPATEGRTTGPRFTSPKVSWRADAAGPAGIAIIKDVAGIGALTGRRLYRVRWTGPARAPRGYLVRARGRLLTPVAAPDGTAWLTTSKHRWSCDAPA
jgi:glucose/arabinose dehydrogenase